jgi:hypothetical protein
VSTGRKNWSSVIPCFYMAVSNNAAKSVDIPTAPPYELPEDGQELIPKHVKGKARPKTGHQGPRGSRGTAVLILNLGARRGG